MKDTAKQIILMSTLSIVVLIVVAGCNSTTDEKFERGEGDFGEGEPCVTTDDCDEKGEICVEGVCVYEENA